MNESQKKVEQCLDHKINCLKEGLHRLNDRNHQPVKEGDVYNGMLKHNVQFEITHMEHLKEELMKVLG